MDIKKEPVLVDYCVEAMEMHLSKLSPRDIDSIVINLAKLINGEIDTLDITMNRTDEKGEISQVRVPAMSFLRTDTSKDALMKLSIPEAIITGYMNRNSVISGVAGIVSIEDKRPNDLNEVRRFIYQALKNRYGTAVISKQGSKDIVIDTKTKHQGNSDVWIKLDYFH